MLLTYIEWFETPPELNTKVYVSNLPLDITQDEFIEVMSKCGMIVRDQKTNKMKVKLYAEPDGQLKGDGLCHYIKVSYIYIPNARYDFTCVYEYVVDFVGVFLFRICVSIIMSSIVANTTMCTTCTSNGQMYTYEYKYRIVCEQTFMTLLLSIEHTT